MNIPTSAMQTVVTPHCKTMKILLSYIILTISIVSCGETNNSAAERPVPTIRKEAHIKDTLAPEVDTIKSMANSKSIGKYFPFDLNEIDGRFQIDALLGAGDLYPKYSNFFQKHGYEGNGYCWEGHIKQILEKIDKGLLAHIDFDSEGDSFFASADTKANQIKFAEILSPIFSDLKKLELWVKKADRSRIDD
jgi:hypothetical protein